MDQTAFRAMTRTISEVPSRRDVLRGLAGVGLGLGMVRIPAMGGAKKKRKRKTKKRKPKVTPNQYGCLEVDDPCQTAEQCCSGICEGKKGKKRCLAHDTGTCKQDGQLVPCNNRTDCGCFRTTAGSDVCAGLATSECAVCQRDADCLALGFPSGTACTPGPCESGMACMPPCATRIPALQDER